MNERKKSVERFWAMANVAPTNEEARRRESWRVTFEKEGVVRREAAAEPAFGKITKLKGGELSML